MCMLFFRDEFLALFESSSQGGRTKGRNKKKPTPAWVSDLYNDYLTL